MSLLCLHCFALWAVAAIDKYQYCFGAAVADTPINLPPIPDNFNLKQVQVVTRHGARTPLYEFPRAQPVWNCTQNQLETPFATFSDENTANRLYRLRYIPRRQALLGSCYEGQLTKLGAQQHTSLGKGFRDAYIGDDKLLPSDLTLNTVYARTTEVPRVRLSAESQLLALYPTMEGKESPIINIDLVEHATDNMYPNYDSCPALRNYRAAISDSQKWKDTEASIKTEIDAINEFFQIDTAARLLPKFIDSFHVMDCHGISYPKGLKLDDVALNRLYEAADVYWDLQWNDRKQAMGALGSFMHRDFFPVFQDTVKGVPGPSFLLYSAHDSTVAPVLGLIGAYDGKWPPLASNIEFELLQSKTNTSVFAVRIIYNGKVLTPENCRDGLCTWAQWMTIVNSVANEIVQTETDCKAPKPSGKGGNSSDDDKADLKKQIEILAVITGLLAVFVIVLGIVVFRKSQKRNGNHYLLQNDVSIL